MFWASRPISWINTAYPFAATYLLVAQALDATFVLGTLFFLIPYNLLMYGINDVFDYESDLRNPRKGGIEGALLAPKWHRLTIWAAVLTCLPFVAYLLLVGNPTSTGWLMLVLFTVVAYSAKGLRFKERPFVDSLTSAAHFVGPMVFAAALAGANLADPKLLALISAFGLWGIASHAFGAVQDVQAVDFLHTGLRDGTAQGLGQNGIVEFFAALFAQLFRVVQTRNRIHVVQNHSRRHDRASQRPSPGLVHPGHQADSVPIQGTLLRHRGCSGSHGWTVSACPAAIEGASR